MQSPSNSIKENIEYLWYSYYETTTILEAKQFAKDIKGLAKYWAMKMYFKYVSIISDTIFIFVESNVSTNGSILILC